MKKIIFLIFTTVAFKTNAQVKVGSNPTTINSNANLQVESASGQQFIITSDSTKVGIGTLVPSARLHVVDNFGKMPLRLEGLANGNVSTDSVLVTNSLGIVRKISPSTLGGGSEPWFNTATNAGATSNTQNIYQLGRVGIGIVNPTAKLEVDGSLSTKFNAGIGSIRITPGTSGTSGYIEFFNPNSTTRAGYIGNANSGNLQYNAENGNRHQFLGGGIFVDAAKLYNSGKSRNQLYT
jgi:hypothetical protein